MSTLREKLDENSMIVGVLAVLTITGVACALVLPGYLKKAPPPLPTQGYYYEVQTGNLVTGPLSQVPPIVDGKTTRVLAYVFSCGSCDDPAARFTGYVFRYTDAAKKSMDATSAQLKLTNFVPPPALPADEKFLNSAKDAAQSNAQNSAMTKSSTMEVAVPAYPEPLKWMSRSSKPAVDAMTKIKTQCDGKAPTSCMPK